MRKNPRPLKGRKRRKKERKKEREPLTTL